MSRKSGNRFRETDCGNKSGNKTAGFMTIVQDMMRALFPLVIVSRRRRSRRTIAFPFPAGATTGSIPAQSDRWSGQPGASGHPLMQPDAILAAVADFKNCIDGMWPEAARRGISRASFEQHTARLEPEVKIMDFVDAQPEFTKAFWDYVDLLVTDERIARGRELLQQHAAAFEAVERAYGVDRHIIAAIWGIETKYGTVAGERPVIRSTATLACVGRRQAYFKDEFLAALEILHRGDIRAGAAEGLMGRRVRPDAVHADRVQALCGRFRRRRAARRGRLGAGRHRLDRATT